ncbi:oligosaccharide repeat unit polymerase [Altererythrobacter confluentis]|uniref:Oligosaccharide repeat unit polymerase n=1 Tax=Allopontixanthobacter confluentis TaxID=1849021 RepID=A0A6L7GJ94_9SPHN|nr:O-antigen polymerase [Allopontixanthobacter confluentis]MXP15374.1 oligosaccharide repeat unit polymerase [Allopontixanthobacter confluentis]
MLAYDIILLVSLAIYLAVCALYLRHRAASFMHPVSLYLLFHGIVFTFRPFLARYYDFGALYQQFGFQPSMQDKITVLLAANLGMVTFVAVSLFVAREPLAFARDKYDDKHRTMLRKPFLIVAALLTPVALASLAEHWTTRALDSSTMITDLSTGIAINTTGNGWFFTAQLVLVPIVVIFAWLYRFRLWSLIPFGIFFILRAGTGGRGPLIVAAFAIVVLYLTQQRRRWPEWRSALIMVFAAVTFTTLVSDRGAAVREIFTSEQAADTIAYLDTAPYETMDFANQEFFEYVVYAVPQRTGTYDYFLSNLQIFTEPVPRAWWPGKPVGPPIQLFSLFDYGSPLGMTLSLPGAGWYELGWAGVIIQCGAFALLYSLLYRWMIARREDDWSLMTYAVMIAATTITFRDGVLITIARSLPFYLGPIAMMWLLARAFSLPRADMLRQFASENRHLPAPTEGGGSMPLTPAQRRRAMIEAMIEKAAPKRG